MNSENVDTEPSLQMHKLPSVPFFFFFFFLGGGGRGEGVAAEYTFFRGGGRGHTAQGQHSL